MEGIIEIPNYNNYTQTVENGTLILTPKPFIDIDTTQLLAMDVKHSHLIDCSILSNETELLTIDRRVISTGSKDWLAVAIDIWKSMVPQDGHIQRLLQATTYNYRLTTNGDNGYKYIPGLGMAFQRKDTSGTIREIIHLVRHNSYGMVMLFKSVNGITYRFQL